MKPESILKLEKELNTTLLDINENELDIWNKNNTYELDSELKVIDLDLSGLKIENCSIEEFTDLRNLSINGSKLKDLSFLNKNINIEKLYLSNNEIVDLTPLQSLKKIEVLDLTQNAIADFTILTRLYNLESLSFGKNPCIDYSFLKNIKNLKHLDVSYLNGYNFKFDFCYLSNLENIEELTLNFNDLEDISFLKSLKKLRKLSLFKNKIFDISVLSELKFLNELILSNNNVEDISSLNGLFNLRFLDLSVNKISDLSPLKALVELKKLVVYNNLISDITDILKLKELEEVELKGNKKVEIDFPREILEAGWDAIRQYSEESKNKVPFKNVKVLLLGNPNIGKSNLLEFLETNKIPVNDVSTHGVKYKLIALSDINFHIWDFGGQEYFHATHKLFFSPNALNVVLWGMDIPRNTNETEDQFFKLDYWLRTVEQLNNNSESEEVLIVENKIDLNNPIYQETVLNQKELSENYRILNLSFTSFSLLTLRRVDVFKSIFSEKAESIISKFNYPAFYDVFWKRIQEINNDFVTVNEINNRPHKENVVSALKVFHNMGMLLYFHDLIPDKVFCNPQVLLDLLYDKVLSKEKKDRLTKSEIEKSVLNNSLDLSVNDVIKLLKHFDLVFEIIEDKDVYFIPQFLKPINPYILDFKKDVFNGCNIKIFGDNYLMSLAMLKIFSKYGNYVSKVGNEYRFWRNGIIIRKDDTVLMIEFNRKKHTIELYQDKGCENINLQKEIVDFILDLPEGNDLPKRNFDNHRNKRWRDVLNPDDEDYAPHFSERIQEYEGYLESFESRNYSNLYYWDSSFFTVFVSLDCEFFVEWNKLKTDEDLSEINFKNESGIFRKVNVKEYCYLINKDIKLEEENKKEENKEVKSVTNNFNGPVNVGIIGDNGIIENQNINPIESLKNSSSKGLSVDEKKAVEKWKLKAFLGFSFYILMSIFLIYVYIQQSEFILSKTQWEAFKQDEFSRLLMFIWSSLGFYLFYKLIYDRFLDPSKENAFIDLYRKQTNIK